MATILEFRQGVERSGLPISRHGRSHDAEIVIFPGVRIERYEDAPSIVGLRPLEDDEDAES